MTRRSAVATSRRTWTAALESSGRRPRRHRGPARASAALARQAESCGLGELWYSEHYFHPRVGGDVDGEAPTSLLLELIQAGRLDVRDRLDHRVTYHDPCYLGRFNGGYDEPRAILETLGCELVEMPRNRANSFCCGAGGGRIWMADEPGVERPSENRIREAVGLGEIDYFVVSCPGDVTMYEDAIKTSGNSDRLELRELTELVEEALDPSPREAPLPPEPR